MSLALVACQEKGQERVSKTGEVAGETAANVVKSVKSGIEKVSKINITVSDPLKTRGISLGKTKLNSVAGGRHNQLNVYMIFDKSINRSVIMKVLNSQGEEIGRTKTLLKATAGEAKYVDFTFDKRCNIDRDHKISME